MLRRSLLAVGMTVLVVSAWAACVGDDPTTTTTPGRGAQGQPCFENNTCLVGLTCVNATCAIDNDGAASSTSSSTSASSSSSGGTDTSTSSGSTGVDAGHDFCGNVSNIDHLICPAEPKDDDCNAGKPKCCIGKGCQLGGSCPDPEPNPVVCFATDQCQNARCCVDATIEPIAPKRCGLEDQVKLLSPGTRPFCSGGSGLCPASAIELCALNGKPCATGLSCKSYALMLAGPAGPYVRIVNACQ